MSQEKRLVFENISGDQEVVEIQSLCMQCHEQGLSRFLLTKVPHFKDLIIAAFECPHCGHRNNEIQSATSIGDKGVRESCIISDDKDLNRQVVISAHASIILNEVDVEVPPKNGRGFLNTVEGVLKKIKEDLMERQSLRQTEDPVAFEKILIIVNFLEQVLSGKRSITFTLDDPSGNSYIEKLDNLNDDPKMKRILYTQSLEQLRHMGFATEVDAAEDPETVYSFGANCHNCGAPCDIKMHMIDIPHFKEVLIMASACDSCGYKNNEVKSGGAISPLGTRISLDIISPEDLNRDVLKSETCKLIIPDLNLDLSMNSLGGRFTTLEGLILQMRDELAEKIPFFTGDSISEEKKEILRDTLGKLDLLVSGNTKCQVILDDPLSNSYIQNLCAPDNDPQLHVETYERSHEQNEEFGINDIKVDNY